MIRAARHIRAVSARFARDEAGSVLVLWMSAFVAVLGLTALVVDMGRVHIAQADLQRFADQVALTSAVLVRSIVGYGFGSIGA